MLIIGITGTLGAGKGTVVEYLIRQKGFHHYSVRAYLLEIIRQRKMPENRDSMFNLANELRAEHGPSYVTDQLYLLAERNGQPCVIESIRTTGEVTSLKEKGNFYLFAVDAIPETRYQRVQLRKSETDYVSFETFLEEEQREMKTTDPNKQNLAGCKQLADFILSNNRTKEDLYRQVEEALAQINLQG
jgi:dephospho-CoA kinase